MRDEHPSGQTGATILNFPTARERASRQAGAVASDAAAREKTARLAATDMVSMRASAVHMLLLHVCQLRDLLPQTVDGLTRRPESALIAGHWAEAADGQDRFLAMLVEILGRPHVSVVDPDLYASTERSAARLRSLIAECRRPPEERAVLFGSISYLRRCVLEELAILERNLVAFDAAARRAAGLE